MIGREAFRVDREHAMEHVAGYTIVNDITTRDLVFREDMKEIGTDWYRGKNAPGFLPTGPVPRARAVRRRRPATCTSSSPSTARRCRMPRPPTCSSTSPRSSPAPRRTCRCCPGDLLLTGSPAGNGIVHGRMLRDGDVMVGAIEGLGAQTVRAVAEAGAR